MKGLRPKTSENEYQVAYASKDRFKYVDWFLKLCAVYKSVVLPKAFITLEVLSVYRVNNKLTKYLPK
jgi:hypothetical protein